MRGVLVFDADNTIWDTDAVFRTAQIALLQTLADGGLLDNPEAHLALLRAIDQRLMALYRRAEYPFDALPKALIMFFARHHSPEDAAEEAFDATNAQAYEPNHPLIQLAHTAFTAALRQVPPLFSDALTTLACLRAASSPTQHIAMILMSEGDIARIERVLSAHYFRERAFFDEILLLEKNAETMAYARSTGYRVLGEPDTAASIPAVLIGDSLKRDIRPANQAGFVTIYKPAAFKGFETPQADDETPAHMIRSLAELPRLLALLGFEIPAAAI